MSTSLAFYSIRSSIDTPLRSRLALVYVCIYLELVLQGYVKLELIRQFNRIKFYSPEKSHMIRCLKNSQVVEVRGDKIRRKGDWMRWVMHPKVWLFKSGIAYV